MESLSQISRECFNAGFKVKESTAKSLSIYIKELIEWNRKVNLTALKSERDILSRLIIPALSFSTLLPCEEESKILDFGSGAGFPGIPLKIAFPLQNITLLDSIGKKVRFLTHVTTKLSLQELRCINDRGETFVKTEGERGRYDFVVAMAVANLFTLKKYTFPFLKTGGQMITLKGEKLSAEIEELEKRVKKDKDFKVIEISEFAPANCTPFKLISIKKCST